MLIATWNVNSIRARLELVTAFLQRHQPDVLTLQETKCPAAKFPAAAFEELGYQAAACGTNGYNGVALLSRCGLSDVKESLPAQPGFAKDAAAPQLPEARAIGATCAGVEVWSLYVPHGRSLTDRHYQYKLEFFQAISRQINPEAQQVFTGDFNVAPFAEDVWDEKAFTGLTHVSLPERLAYDGLLDAGLVDPAQPGQWTYWDYQHRRFDLNQGMRIDFQLATAPVAAKVTKVTVDQKERATAGTSDHAPLLVEYDL